MFNSFKHRLPQVSIFHSSSSQPSIKALALLRNSLSSSYPSDKPASPPLEFSLEVVESPPTTDQLRTILSYFPSAAVSPAHALLSAHPSAPSVEERPTTLGGIVQLAQENPQAVKWPIVVDWDSGKAAIGDIESVRGILEHLRKKRDGEIKEDEVDQPKGWFT
ncbi:hypothetical protein P691DRAFT_776986 [Macrolepiota fuliginosa MF-IS2]|uniref:Thioredoxin-like protein n=1 Tax=Macrolepiota fuliginosa MF-IS2 TaxID=1400762 RepID=A0A9P5XAW4_9AGAR|nr:hypothetical protein P691DRAFT_776986 [Macrolepiota fuliginosa MF-IS2]